MVAFLHDHVDWSSRRDVSEMKANRKLMICAPELQSALYDLVSLIETIYPVANEFPEMVNAKEALMKAVNNE